MTPEQNGGVIKTIKTEGSGDSPMTGDTVSVHYVGTLLESGEQFDSSRDRGDKFEFKLGVEQVIKGWDLGVASMKRGEVCDLVCTADYAYGKSGSPPKIPGGASLKFEVELFDFFGEDVSEDKDKSILKRIHDKGDGWATPNDGAKLQVEMEGFTVPGNESFGVFSSDDLSHGEETGKGLPKFVEKVIDDMKCKEKCEIVVSTKHAFTEPNKAFPNAPLNESMKFVINLKLFEKCKESWEMTVIEKIEQAKLKRDVAKKYLQEGNYTLAIKLFEKVVSILEDEVKRAPRASGSEADSDSDDDDAAKDDVKVLEDESNVALDGDGDAKNEDEFKTNPEIAEIMEASQLNLSLCFLKTKDYNKAVEQCENVLNSSYEVKDEKREKAMFRRAECHFFLHDYEEAKNLFTQLLEQFPNNSAAKKRHLECDQKAKAEKLIEKQRYQRMFKNFST